MFSVKSELGRIRHNRGYDSVVTGLINRTSHWSVTGDVFEKKNSVVTGQSEYIALKFLDVHLTKAHRKKLSNGNSIYIYRDNNFRNKYVESMGLDESEDVRPEKYADEEIRVGRVFCGDIVKRILESVDGESVRVQMSNCELRFKKDRLAWLKRKYVSK